MPVLAPTAAAIDVGREQLPVSIAGGPPRISGTTTGQLHALRDWLQENGVRSVAMEPMHLKIHDVSCDLTGVNAYT